MIPNPLTHYPNGKPKSEKQMAYEARVKKSNEALAKDPLLQTMVDFSPLGTIRDVDQALKTGDVGDIALAGATALAGPLAGPAAKVGTKAAKAIGRAAPEIKGAIKGLDPEYAKLAWKEMTGAPTPAPKSVGASAKHGTWDRPRHAHVLDPKQSVRHQTQNVGKSREQILDDYADAQAILRGDVAGGPKDKIAKNVSTFEGPRDFLQYETPEGKIKHFMGKDGKIRTNMAGDAEFDMLGTAIDTPKTWKGRGPLSGKDYKSTTGSSDPIAALADKQGWSYEKAAQMYKILGG